MRRENRIRSIHSSLAIENNSLSLDEVTAVINGKRVLAPPKDIREVQNAYDAYEALVELDPFSVEDLLKAHGFMMAGLVRDAGCFRSGNVGVFAGEVLVHAGTPAAYVPQLIADLFGWLRTTETHPLVASCIFHSEFEFIHPFSDGNGRTGRLWHSLLLRRWNRLFEWLPVETMVAEHQFEYYDALGSSQQNADCAVFVEFMLSVILQAVESVDDEQINYQINERHRRVLEYLGKNPLATISDNASAMGVSNATVRRDLAHLRELGIVRRNGSRKAGSWEVVRGRG
ncbi:MAG: Fic family protein [Atopobiaceae bacterium]|nr:Fic family protein [Atopobiaceae bacterium]